MYSVAEAVVRRFASRPAPVRGEVTPPRRCETSRRPVMPDPVRSRKPSRPGGRRAALVTVDEVLEFEREIAGATADAVREAREEPVEPAAPPTTAAVLRDAQSRREVEGDCCFSVRGMTQGEARRLLEGFLRERRAAGVRFVKVIHGKGKGSPGEPVLRRRVPQWLESWKPELVAGYEPVRREREGGGGALYVVLTPVRGPSSPAGRAPSE